jgi:hypothetical protein
VLQDCALARHDKDPMISATAKNFILRMKGKQAPSNVALPLLAFYAALAGAERCGAMTHREKLAKKAADCVAQGKIRGGCFYIGTLQEICSKDMVLRSRNSSRFPKNFRPHPSRGLFCLCTF